MVLHGSFVQAHGLGDLLRRFAVGEAGENLKFCFIEWTLFHARTSGRVAAADEPLVYCWEVAFAWDMASPASGREMIKGI
jgi:hypothetical protein